MKFYSTRNRNYLVSLKEAVMHSLPPDGGLYMPVEIPQLSDDFLNRFVSMSFRQIAFHIVSTLLSEALTELEISRIVENSITFPAPVVQLNKHTAILELFHGPSLAFKDFGAQFMAKLMELLIENDDKEVTILVATSGDTGGAVAAGFYKTPGVRVIILYPQGKVSELQEKQLVTWGENIQAIEIEGTFDDCQSIVKQAFLDSDLNSRFQLSSANSINIARLIPQCFYYFEAIKQIKNIGIDREIVFSVPSGNFGNLTAGLIAYKLGLPSKHFLAASNVNDSVPRYLISGTFEPKETIQTLSNAMDVGNPSNFPRILELFQIKNNASSTWNNLNKFVKGFAFNDQQTLLEMKRIYRNYNYIMDPHGAVASLALEKYISSFPDIFGIALETAHPAKFLSLVESTLDCEVKIPERLNRVSKKTKKSEILSRHFVDFKEWMVTH